MKEAGITISREKSKLCPTEVEYLGVTVNCKGFKPNPETVDSIINYRAPKKRFVDVHRGTENL